MRVDTSSRGDMGEVAWMVVNSSCRCQSRLSGLFLIDLPSKESRDVEDLSKHSHTREEQIEPANQQ